MEIGNETLYDVVAVSRHDDDAGRSMKDIKAIFIHPRQQGLKGLNSGQAWRCLVWFPLLHLSQRLMVIGPDTKIIQAFESTDARCSDSHRTTSVGDETLDGGTLYTDKLTMHLMAANRLTLDGLKGAGSDMKRHLFALYSEGVDVMKHTVGEMQSGGRCCHTALDACIDGLVGYLVIRLGMAVEVWRYG